MQMGKKNDNPKGKKGIHEDLKGFDVRINHFGQIESNFDVDKVNAFLNDQIEDKKLKNPSKQAKDDEQE